MWFPLLILVLFLAIAFYQSTLGLFSAMLMTVLAICCASGALGTYEWVAMNWLAPNWMPNFACSIALAGSFFIPLIALRVLTDRLIRRASLLPAMVDRIGGAVCGVVTSFVLIGVTAHAVQMIPFSHSILGFSRVDSAPEAAAEKKADIKPPDPQADENELWLAPDRFAVGVGYLVSSGVFSGERLLTDDHPDLVQATGWVNAVNAEVSRIAQPGSVSVVRTRLVPLVYQFIPADPRGGAEITAAYEPKPPQAGHEFRMVRVKLGRAARDEHKSHRFTLRQFRLLGRPEGRDLKKQYFPIAIQQEDATQTTNRHIRTRKTRAGEWPVIDDLYEPRDGNNDEVEIVFELPLAFQPTYLEYKRCARTPVSFESQDEEEIPEPAPQVPASQPSDGGDATAPAEPGGSADSGRAPESAPAAAPPTRARRDRRARGAAAQEEVPTSGRAGRVRGLTTQAGQSFFGDALPAQLAKYSDVRATRTSGQALAEGHLIALLDEQDGEADARVSKFQVPSEKRLLQLNTGRLHARSGFGQILSMAAATVQNYSVEDSNGNRYSVIGKYARAGVDGRQTLEIQYFPEQAGTIGGLGKFNKIKDEHLKDDYDLVMLFLVDPGAEIVSFSTGGSATRADDLRNENLVAPN